MNITVYCGSTFGCEPAFNDAAAEFGRKLGESGNRLVYGGSRTGTMGTLARAALDAGGEVIGVEPRFFVDDGYELSGLTELIVVETVRERKGIMLEKGDAFVALPGGTGTLDEIVEVLSLRTLGKHEKPVFLLNLNGYYEPLKAMLDQMVKAGFLTKENREKIVFPESVSELSERLGL